LPLDGREPQRNPRPRARSRNQNSDIVEAVASIISSAFFGCAVVDSMTDEAGAYSSADVIGDVLIVFAAIEARVAGISATFDSGRFFLHSMDEVNHPSLCGMNLLAIKASCRVSTFIAATRKDQQLTCPSARSSFLCRDS